MAAHATRTSMSRSLHSSRYHQHMEGIKRSTDTSFRLLNAVLVHGNSPLTVAALSDAALVSPRAATEHTRRLKDRRLLERGDEGMRFGPGAGLVLAVAIGGASTRVALVDANCEVRVVERVEAPAQLTDSPSVVMSRASRAIEGCIACASGREELLVLGELPIVGIICTVPSAVDRDGIVRGHALGDRQWRARTVPEHLKLALPEALRGIPIDFMNNANAEVLAIGFDRIRARALTEDREDDHSEVVITVRLSHGVGAGTLQLARYERSGTFALTRSRLVVGSAGLAGELGHLPMFKSDLADVNAGLLPGLKPVSAVECSCHNRDHLESYATLRALSRRLTLSGYGDLLARPDFREVLDHADDEVLHRALTDIGRLVGRALSSTILMLDPKVVALSGILGVDAVKDGMLREQHRWSEGVPTAVVVATLPASRREDLVLRGAAAAVLRRQVWAQRELSRLGDGSAS